MVPTLPTGQAMAGHKDRSTLSGKQGGCCRQLVSQLMPVTKATLAAGSGVKSRSWSISWPHCMNKSERSRSGVSCSVGKRTMALETARAWRTRGVSDRLGLCPSNRPHPLCGSLLTKGTGKPPRLTPGVQP